MEPQALRRKNMTPLRGGAGVELAVLLEDQSTEGVQAEHGWE